jgi:ABC-type oligopeptide transport system ATPase subunit
MNLLETRNLKKYFPVNKAFLRGNRTFVKAVDDISLSISQGETLGLVGESGCGKSTFGRLVLRLIELSAGNILYNGEDIALYSAEKMRNMRRSMQIIFQDPYGALNPRMTVKDAIIAPLEAFTIGTPKEREGMVKKIMERVGLRPEQIHRYPPEFSGGQRQRIVIARALILNPRFVVCDEPVSALDVSVRSQVINLMSNLL